MAELTLSARIREDKGKGVARKLRRESKIPAVLYGANAAPLMLVVDYAELSKLIKQGSSENVLIALQILSDGETDTKRVMLKELQVDPVKDVYLHADFFEISMDREITVDIPIHLMNTPKGVADGGILQHVKRELTVSCLPDKLVEYIEVDVADLGIGDSIHVKHIHLPDGIETSEEGDVTLATVVAPSVIVEEEVEKIEEEEVTEEAEEAITEPEEESESK